MFNALPAHLRRQFISPGSILYLNIPFPEGDRNKYVVIASQTNPPLLLVINSGISPFIRRNQYLLDAQIGISPQDYPRLPQNSYLNAGQVINYLSRQEIFNQISANSPRRLIGYLTASHAQTITGIVAVAKDISPIHRKAIIAALKGYAPP